MDSYVRIISEKDVERMGCVVTWCSVQYFHGETGDNHENLIVDVVAKIQTLHLLLEALPL